MRLKKINTKRSHIRRIKKLKNIGIKLSLDDYGAGYNSLKYLLRFVGVFDYLKIDKIFIDNILKDESFIIVECIIKFAHSLGMKIIAEVVENRIEELIVEKTLKNNSEFFFYG